MTICTVPAVMRVLGVHTRSPKKTISLGVVVTGISGVVIPGDTRRHENIKGSHGQRYYRMVIKVVGMLRMLDQVTNIAWLCG